MGSGNSKQVLEVITHPDNEAEVKMVFESFDKDKSGALSTDEWRKFCKYLWQVDVDQALDQKVKELRQQEEERHQKQLAQMGMGGLGKLAGMGSGARSAGQYRQVNELKRMVKPKDVEEWCDKMFSLADKDKGGNISYPEFLSFLQNESKAEATQQAANMAQAGADPHARMQAAMHARPDPFGLNAKMTGAVMNAVIQEPDQSTVAGANAAGIKHMMTAEYKVGEQNQLSPHEVALVKQHPKMFAQYEKKPALVTQVMHTPDLVKQRALLDADPELKLTWFEFQQDMMIKAQNEGAGPRKFM